MNNPRVQRVVKMSVAPARLGYAAAALLLCMACLGGATPAPQAAVATSTETAAPHPPSDPLVARGQAVFRKANCSMCHGVDGISGTVAAPGLAGTASTLPAPVLQHMLRHHTPEMKKGGMPVTNFNSGDLASIAAYIRSLPAQSAAVNHQEAPLP